MTRAQLFENIKKKQSFLCIGLDTDLTKIPKHLLSAEDPAFEFNRQIIDATHDLCVSYKPNIAFYESEGISGWRSLERTIAYLNENYPDQFTIADAKRGDIGNTSQMYARAFLEKLDFDSVTVAPYMGEDSVTPFLGYDGKWVILLALTSNKGAADLQTPDLFKKVLKVSSQWGNPDNMMYVVGATRAEMLTEVRAIVPQSFLLVPGVGAQGGSLEEVARYGMNAQCGLLVNSSRGIIYASGDTDFAERARAEAILLRDEMSALLQKHLS
jgi:orotidine-5'-phosphate decarboxylase